ncbi:MAG TPA: VWA domain-containing protein [Acidobacteriaceae bacterium]|jgi:VWFA-related protein
MRGPAVHQNSAPPQEPTPALTLHAASRIVLADLIVTDAHGNPVHGLTAADFQVFDNGKPQRIASFEEHTDEPTETSAYNAPTPSGTATNTFQHLPPILNVVLIDTTNLELPDQIYLRIQLTKFLNNLPAAQPIAVFDRHGDYTVLLQPFTSDRALLQAAVNRAIPRIPLNGREYRSDSATLRQIGAYLIQVPGRKNVLWFSGGSTAYLLYGLSALTASTSVGPPPSSAAGAAAAAASAPSTPVETPSVGEGADELREVYDELEAARIAVYPIDARGLTTGGDVALGPQQSQMIQTAEATGGQAFYNSNSLALVASHILSTDSSSYTLTYSPQNFHYDGKWHNIRIEGRRPGLHLNYRRGYFADQTQQPAPKSRKLNTLFAGDSGPLAAPDLRSSPLIFKASVHPVSTAPSPAAAFIPLRPAAPAAKGTTAFDIDYSLSTSTLTSATVDGAPRATVVFAALALDSDGNRIGQAIDRVRFPLTPDSPARRLDVEQQIDLPRGSGFVTVTVWDPASGHIGTLQVPVTAGKK